MAEEIYVEANAKVFEAIYGKGYISLGGEVALNKIFEKIDLDQKKIVDLGFGLGGASLFLAKKYQSNIIGLEVHSWMADFALNSANSELKNRIKFKIYEPDSFFPLENSSVDFLFCKGVLTNIKDKSNIFSETFRVLSPKGEILLIDWLVPECIGSQSSTLYMGDKSHKETKSSYEKILLENGFRNISFEDCSHEYLAYVKNLDILYKSKEHQEKFSTIINQDLRKMLIQSNLELLKSIESKEQFSYKIRAEK